MRPAFAIAMVLLFTWSVPSRAQTQRWEPSSVEDANDQAVEDGDVDEEDRVALGLGRELRSTPVIRDAPTWVSLVGLDRWLTNGQNDVGAMAVVGVALDRASTPSASPPNPRRLELASVPHSGDSHPMPADTSQASSPKRFADLARACVVAAWRATGLGVDDAALDALLARARTSALLPETRFRALRRWDDASRTAALATSDATNTYDTLGANLLLEVRLTWRLDRMLYASEEPSVERLKLERNEARSRVASRTLQALFAWRRATIDANEAERGSREGVEARVRATEAQATLDVITAGWSGAHLGAPDRPEDAERGTLKDPEGSP